MLAPGNVKKIKRQNFFANLTSVKLPGEMGKAECRRVRELETRT